MSKVHKYAVRALLVVVITLSLAAFSCDEDVGNLKDFKDEVDIALTAVPVDR